MSPEEFSNFSHDAVHDLMRLNEACEREFRISSWPRWFYDFDQRSLSFLDEDNVPRVVASIQVVGTTSKISNTWLWSWDNKSLPGPVTEEVKKVQAFGHKENVTELTTPCLPDNEHFGWKMTAVAAKILGSRGAYRCPGENGFIYFLYADVSFAELPRTRNNYKEIACGIHDKGYETFVCEHLVSNPEQEWCGEEPTAEHQWPDAWCRICNICFLKQNEWNESNSSELKVKLLCHRCYENLRSQALPQARSL